MSEAFHPFGYFSLSACLVILAAVIVTAAVYRGREGERYSPLNHFISELGETGVSRLAPVFNGALILGGMLFVPFIVGLGTQLNSFWSMLAMLAGLGTCVACVAVGFFPMNRLELHSKAALAFFRLGLVMVTLFSIAVLAQPPDRVVLPYGSVFFGALTALAYAAFLFLHGRRAAETGPAQAHSLDATPERPRIWLLPILEWAVLATTLFWFAGIAIIIS